MSPEERMAQDREHIQFVGEVLDNLVAVYGEVGIHSEPRGGWCIHLGKEEKGCKEPDFVGMLSHAAMHAIGDTTIDEATKGVSGP